MKRDTKPTSTADKDQHNRKGRGIELVPEDDDIPYPIAHTFKNGKPTKLLETSGQGNLEFSIVDFPHLLPDNRT